MYDELVKRLRCQLYGNCPACVNWYTEEVEPNLWRARCAAIDAADAIEELTAERDEVNADSWKTAFEVERDEHRWIPVTERLPENEVPVLVVRRFLGVKDCPPKTYVEMAEYCYGDWVADSDEYKIARHRHTDPLFWMPLPEPPKEEEGET